MKPVIQEEVTGCGIAACAAIAGTSYAEAKKVANELGIFADDQSLWSKIEPVQQLLKQLGVQTAQTTRPFSSWEALPDLALLAIKWHEENGQPFWHWTVFVRDDSGCYVLDSKKALTQHSRKDFGRIKPKWYLQVKR